MNALLAQLRLALYLATVVIFSVVIVRAELVDYSRWQHEYVQHFGNFKYRFLTTWNFLILSAHALLSLICEYLIISNCRRKVPYLSQLLSLRDALFNGIVFPLSVLVFSVFWGLYHVDRELIFPDFMEEVLPPFDNHMVHTGILPLVLLETVLQPRTIPRSHAKNVALLTGLFVVYGIPFLGTYYVHGKFLYPFIQLMSPMVFVAFCAVLWAYTLFLYALQWPIVFWRWGLESVKVE